MIANFVEFRHDVIIRRTRFELEKAQKRAHILEGLLKAIDVIDEIIHIIRHSSNVDEAKAELISRFEFTDAQATAIVEMRLRQLTDWRGRSFRLNMTSLRSSSPAATRFSEASRSR